MIEVLWHGRGGQGAFTAARLLGAAASLGGKRHALAFPAFGPERRGAPIKAFTKISDAPIGDRSAIALADYAIYLDDTLFGKGWEGELKPDGLVLVNSTATFDEARIIAVDADGLSRALLGRPIPNTVFLGVLSALCDSLALADVQEAIRQYLPVKLHEKNLLIVEEAARFVAEPVARSGIPPFSEPTAASGTPPSSEARILLETPTSSEPLVLPEARVGANSVPHDATFSCKVAAGESAPTISGAAVCEGMAQRRVHIPTLRSDTLDPSVFAHSTCFEAGYLTVKNAGWRNIRPVINEGACTGCFQCYLHCPDGVVYKVPVSGQSEKTAKQRATSAMPVMIDLDFCKGCGICARVCRFGAIAMAPERNPESEADGRPLHPERSAEGVRSNNPARRQPETVRTQQQESEADAR